MQLLTAAIPAAGGAGGGISALSILQGAATIGGVLATLGAGQAQAESYKAQAFHSEMEAQNEVAQGVQRRTAMKRELLRVIGENDVAFAAAGLDVGSGVAAETRASTQERASQELSIDRSTQDARAAMLRAQAAGYQRMAKMAKRNAAFGAIGQLFG